MSVEEAPENDDRFGHVRLWFERIESLYLVILRVSVLVAATGLLSWAAWLAVSGLYKVSLSPESVKTGTASVSTEEVLTLPPQEATAAGQQGGSGGAASQSPEATYYKGFVDRYYALFTKYYGPSRREEDTPLTREAFDRIFVNSAHRIEMINDGELSFGEDSALLERMIVAIQAASASETTAKRLKAYKSAVRVKETVSVTKSRAIRECSYYSYYYGCLTFQTRYQPYTERVVVENLPKGIIGYAKLMQTYQDTFVSTLTERQRSLNQQAADKRAAITLGKQVGAVNLGAAIKFVSAFLMLMFFFLLVAIERHQRRLSAVLKDMRSEPGPVSA